MSATQLDRVATAGARLNLIDIEEHLPVLAQTAAKKGWTHTRLVCELLETMAAEADRRSAETMLKLATFPYRKTIDEFDFAHQTSIPRRVIDELAEGSYIARRENLIFLGPPGTGKTHLAVALGMVACSTRMRVKFTTCSNLIARLREAKGRNTYSRVLRNSIRPRVLIIDEVGFTPLTAEESSMLFDVVCARYEQGSIILTSNKSFTEWGEIFSGDTVIATAMLDRLLHHSHNFVMKGGSYRMTEHKREAKKR